MKVSVPATSANLGPGFDCLGLALNLRDTVAAEEAEGLAIEVIGEGAGEVPTDESHLVVRAMDAGFAAFGSERPGLKLTCTNVIPHGRGLGSSAAAIVSGLMLARAIADSDASDGYLLSLATELEGHPDNVAPALFGGFTISGTSDGAGWAQQGSVDAAVRAVAFVPPEPVSTEAARGLLPEVVPHADAAANASRAALLVSALAGATEHLWRGTEDFLHQRYRRPAMPESVDLVDALRADGIAAIISGAGPTVLALVTDGAEGLLARCPAGWTSQVLEIDRDGAVLLS